MPVTLLIGGARSGKSRVALERAKDSGRPVVFIATAERIAGDAEWEKRIARHVADRPAEWTTIETPLDLPQTVAALDGEVFAIVDCLTVWLSNLLHHGRDLDAESESLRTALDASHAQIVLVSNELGLGLVPETEVGRTFRDAQGRLNQMLAERAARVEFIAAGISLILKSKTGA